MTATEEKKVQIGFKVGPEVQRQLTETTEVLLKSGVLTSKGDLMKYLLDSLDYRSLLLEDEWSQEVRNLNNYTAMIVKTFESLITKTRGKYDLLEEQRERELDELRDKLAEKEAFTKSFQDELKQRDELIGQQVREIAELKKLLAEKSNEHDNLQTQYKSVHTLFQEANENRQQILLEKERHIQTLEQRLDEQAATITTLETTVQQMKVQQNEQTAAHETQLVQIRDEYEAKLTEARADHSQQLASIEEKTEQQRLTYESKIDAIRTEQEASRQSLRAELEQKYEEKLNTANERIQELTASKATADTLRQLAEERVKELTAAAANTVKKPTTTTRKATAKKDVEGEEPKNV